MKRAYLMLLWHMHQPFYKDLAEGLYAMPWVRLHALKDYYGMVAILRDFPSVHVTFNLVPSLVAQLEDYAREAAREPAFELAFKPVGDLTSEEKHELLTASFQLNKENLLNRHPRFRELLKKVEATDRRSAARLLTPLEILDLQVLSQVAWFDEIYLEGDPEIRALVAKERGYNEEDKALLLKKELEILNKVLQEYRQASERGQIEVSTSPFYHPIMPLLCDTNIAAESHPGVRLPRRHFSHPEDARAQVQQAVRSYERVFGKPPRGLWPSEGSVSDEVLRLAAQEGFEWAATDEGVLGRTLQQGFARLPDGTVWGGDRLYRPYRFVSGDRPLTLFFRDHQLSDLIGFVYSRMDAQSAAADLHNRIRAVARSTGDRPAMVSVVLDGENAWEYFPGNGRAFLKAFYGRVAADPELSAVTASEAVGLVEPERLEHIVPGSWINANFDVWIGAEEDNRAWDLLAEARDFFAEQSSRPEVSPEQAALAREELFIAEGSDWCWWYGPEHFTPLAEEFDLLYRKHLSNVYRLLGSSPPDELATPIKRPRARPRHVQPTGTIEPRIDGQVSSYFEWLGAGMYEPDYRSASMHGGGRFVQVLYYGYSERALYLRIDMNESFAEQHPSFEIRVNVGSEGLARVHAHIEAGKVGQVEFWKKEEPVAPVVSPGGELEVGFGRIFELRLDRNALGPARVARTQIQVSIWVKELPVQVIPQEGSLELELTDDLVSW